MPYTAASTIVGALAITGTAATVATVALTVAFTIAGAALTKALFGKKKPSGWDLSKQDNVHTFREPTADYEKAYGVVRKGGSYAFIHTTDNNHILHLVIILLDHRIEEYLDIYLDEDLVPFGADGEVSGLSSSGVDYAGYAKCYTKLGTDDQTAFQELMDAAPDKWTSKHRLRGKACIYVQLRFNRDLYSAIPNISAVMKTSLVFDPRDITQDINDPLTWKYSANAALCQADYISDDIIGMDARGDVEEDYLIAAANACDEQIPLRAGGTENRYECHGIVDSNVSHREILQGLMSASAGEVVPIGSRWRITAGVWQAPSFAVNDNHLRGAPTTQTRRPRKELYNGVRGVYVSPENHYQASDFPAVISDAFVALDGQENFHDIDLPFTASPSMAQRLAKIILLKARQEITTSLPCKLSAFAVQAGDNITLTRDFLGWEAKEFHVTRSVIVDDDGFIGVNLALEETHSTIYDWFTDEERIIDPAPNTNLPNPFAIGPPTIMVESGETHLIEDTRGQLISQMLVKLMPPLDAFLDRYHLRWRREGTEDWSEMTLIPGQDRSASFMVTPVVDLDLYYIQARSQKSGGASSDFAEVTHTVQGTTGLPPDVEEFLLTTQSDGTRQIDVTYVNEPLDVRNGGGINIYRVPGSIITPADYIDANKLNKQGYIKQFPHEFNTLDAGQWAFACEVEDVNQSKSPNPKTLVVDLPTRRTKDALFEQTERALGWTGTPTDCSVVGNVLLPNSTGVINDLPATIDALPAEILDISPVVGSCTYELAEIDLGADLTFQPFFTVLTDGVATIQIRTGSTADGSANSAYGPSGQVTGVRYLQAMITITGARYINDIVTVIDGSNEIEEFNDINTATESALWFERIGVGHFRIASRSGNLAAVTGARIEALQGSGAATHWILENKSSTVGGEPAAEFKTYLPTTWPLTDADLADAVIDAYVKGPKK